jgi:hypothetical protein
VESNSSNSTSVSGPNDNQILQIKRASILNQNFASNLVDQKVISQNNCLKTPCYLENEKVIAFIDCGASHSIVSKSWVERMNIPIKPVNGILKQCIDGSTKPRIGVVEDLLLENGKKILKVTLEVAELADEEDLIIGMDLFASLGFTVSGVPFTWPERTMLAEKNKNEPKHDLHIMYQQLGLNENGISPKWTKVLEDNQQLPANSRCKLPGATLKIETVGDPVWIRQYPIPEGYKEAVTKQVEIWRENGTIIPAPIDCEWNLPLLAVRKPSKDGSPDGVRVCLDARPLNNKIVNVPDSHLPGIRELQDKLGDFEWITVLDLMDSYHQFGLRQENQQKTTFTWNGQQWMFAGVPFGLKIMTDHMQRLMEKLLGHLNILPFQDDIAIATKRGEDHTAAVLKVLNELTYTAGLKLKLKKCHFFQVEAKVLGSLLTRNGIKMDPIKIKAIVEWPRPIDGKALQRFLGAANFHRDFTHKFAEISAPLEEVRNTSGLIEWSPERIAAFENIKSLFSSNLLLRNINWNKTLYLTTDASLFGIGAWLG